MSRILPLALTLVNILSWSLVPTPAQAEPKGDVTVVLEWHSGRRVYTYVFSGTVRNGNKPCPNAQVQLQVSLPSQPDLFQETVTAEDGTYQLTVSLPGNPAQSADWKLLARAPQTSILEATTVEGRSILMDNESPILVKRSVELAS